MGNVAGRGGIFPVQKQFRAIISALAFMLWAAPACADRINVYAAASLKDALDDIIKQYQADSRNTAVGVYAASSALAKQIENGAPADIFISADLDWMNYLDTRKLLQPNTRLDLLRNRLVLIAAGESRIETEIKPGFPLAQLLGGGRLAIADPESVPAGKYGRAALENLGVWASVSNRIARAENVRAALVFVARGEAPLGIVYRTDALVEKKVRIVGEFPADTHPPIVFPAAIVASAQSSAARRFLSFLSSPPARKIWEKYGFTMAN